jgi:tetratricopeptide (TPR) repeat protein
MIAVAQQLGDAGRENEAQRLMNIAQQLAEALGLFDSEPSSISTETFDQMPHTVYVLLYNPGTDDEGIHTISKDDKHTILIFESSADAANFARQLGEQNFPVPSVEALEYENILGFCQQQGYDWEFVAQGTNITPPSQNKTINQQDTFVDQSSQRVTPDIAIFNQQDYLKFLGETLLEIVGNPNPQVIYPFWAQNLDKLDDNLIHTLDGWAKNTLTSVKAEKAESLAGVIVDFSNLIAEFPLGNIAINQEIAITGYEIALKVRTFDVFSQDWAMTQNNLAIAYSDRIRGDKAENLEKAIAAYTEALKVFTFDAFPQDWATTQNNLAAAYSDRIRGDKAENLEQAIAACTEALKVMTFDAFPQDWARTQNNLANAYRNRIRGDKAENLEQAIAACTEALKVMTFDAFPQQWARTQNNLANAYRDRRKGNKSLC